MDSTVFIIYFTIICFILIIFLALLYTFSISGLLQSYLNTNVIPYDGKLNQYSSIIEGFAWNEGLSVTTPGSAITLNAGVLNIVTTNVSFQCNYGFTGTLLIVANGGAGAAGSGGNGGGGGGGGAWYYDTNYGFIQGKNYSFTYNSDGSVQFGYDGYNKIICGPGGNASGTTAGGGGRCTIYGSTFISDCSHNGNSGGSGGTSQNVNNPTITIYPPINIYDDFMVGGGGGGAGTFGSTYSGEYINTNDIYYGCIEPTEDGGYDDPCKGKSSYSGFNDEVRVNAWSYGNGGGGGRGGRGAVNSGSGGAGSSGALVIYYNATEPPAPTVTKNLIDFCRVTNPTNSFDSYCRGSNPSGVANPTYRLCPPPR